MDSLPGNSEAENIAKSDITNEEIVKSEQEGPEIDHVEGTKKRCNEELDDTQSFDDEQQPLSKRQKKKLLKQQKYEERKKARKEKKKERQKLKREQREKQEGDGINPQDLKPLNNLPAVKHTTMASPEALPLNVVIDLSFDHLMSDKDIKKLAKQLQRCYSMNRRSPHPLQLYFTSFGDKCKKRLDELQGHYRSWDVHIKEELLTDVFPKDDIIYLTSDSSNVLEDFDLSKTYVIGGLVDHNHHKGLCYNIAVSKGIGHAQLPIKEYLQLTTRTVLTVNQVYEIIMYYMESKDWRDAIFKVIPQRKIIPKVRKKHRDEDKDDTEGNLQDGNNSKDDSDESF